MAVLFTNKRLHVGHRYRDWADVWYEPIGEPDDEGNVEFGLFTHPRGGPKRREPMDGEVAWNPYYDHANSESKKFAEKKRIQKQFLHDAYEYLAEGDPDKVQYLEEKHNNEDGDFVRWNSWFKHARKYKKVKMRTRVTRKKRRLATAKEAGIGEDDIEVNSDTSDDSAYDSEEEAAGGAESVKFPRTPESKPRNTEMNRKRKMGNDLGSGRQDSILPDGTKEPRLDRRERHTDGDIFMSGGLDAYSPNHGHADRNVSLSSLVYTINGRDLDEEEAFEQARQASMSQAPFGDFDARSQDDRGNPGLGGTHHN